MFAQNNKYVIIRLNKYSRWDFFSFSKLKRNSK